jgi:glycosyltransferase involved in cell wall biosynthesis
MNKKNVLKELKSKKIIIVTHTRAIGLPHLLHTWLVDKTNTLTYIDHALHPAYNTKSNYIFYKKGKKIAKKDYPSVIKNKPIGYLKDFILTILLVLRYGQVSDIGIGANNLNTLSLLILKRFGKVKTVIFHTVDYTPYRYSNRMLNSIYHWIDRYCCKHADLLWNSSARMNEGRKKYGVKVIAPTIITPDGSNFDEKERLSIQKIDKNLVIFLGHLRHGMGLPMIVKAFSLVVKKNKSARLLIIGGGPLQDKLVAQTKKLSLEKYITFTGFIEKHNEVDILMSKAAIGLAPFEEDKESIEYYSDVGKPKAYLAAGLPVIITRVPEIATEIEKHGAGIIVQYSDTSIAHAVILLLSDKKLYGQYRMAAIKLSKKYSWPVIFEKAFLETFK